MITKAGAKLLDFGLAKAAELEIFDGATVQKPLTQEGVVRRPPSKYTQSYLFMRITRARKEIAAIDW